MRNTASKSTPFRTFDKRFDELFLSVLDLKIRQVRSSEFLNWRYRGVPGRKYITYYFEP